VADSPNVTIPVEGELNTTASEAVTVTDTATLAMSDLQAAASEAVTVADTPQLSIVVAGTLALAVTENVTVTDTPAVVLPDALALAASEAVSVADSPSAAVQAAIACFYAVFITTLSGLSIASANSVSLMQSLGASKFQTLIKLRVPSALPVIFGGLQLGATTAIIGAIVSEFVGADAGLGFLLLRYRSSYDTPAAWVLILCFLVIGVSAYLLISFAEKKIVFWRSVAVSRPDLEKNDN
jgi:ABC-type proline/glycine betaine transport system permease subunit